MTASAAAVVVAAAAAAACLHEDKCVENKSVVSARPDINSPGRLIIFFGGKGEETTPRAQQMRRWAVAVCPQTLNPKP